MTLQIVLHGKPVRSWFCNLRHSPLHGKRNSQHFMYRVRNDIEALSGFEGLAKVIYHTFTSLTSHDVLVFSCKLFALWLIHDKYILNSLYSPQLLCLNRLNVHHLTLLLLRLMSVESLYYLTVSKIGKISNHKDLSTDCCACKMCKVLILQFKTITLAWKKKFPIFYV